MTVVIYILGIIGLLIALVLIVAIFVKKACVIQRSVTINKREQEVFDYVKFIRNAENYSK